MRRIALFGENKEDAGILLAALCTATVGNYVRVRDIDVHFDILDDGEERLYGEEYLSNVLKTSRKSDDYSLTKVLKDPASVPSGELGISVRYGEMFCGRVHFGVIDSLESLGRFEADAVIVIIKDTLFACREIIKRAKELCVPIAAAVIPNDWEECSTKTADSICKSRIDDITILSGIARFCLYDPYGFYNGNRLGIESCSPYGALELFRHATAVAAEHSLKRLGSIIKNNQKVIFSHASVFERRSIRRMIELDIARQSYCRNAAEILVTENLLVLTDDSFSQEVQLNEA